MAVITGLEGPSYRPLGAMMAISADGTRRVGSLSSGCIERDIAQAASALPVGATPRMLRYGSGSPFGDLRLPCGGGMEVALLHPDRAALAIALAEREARRAATLRLDLKSGAMTLGPDAATARIGDQLRIRLRPALRLVVIGSGAEALHVAALAEAAGIEVTLSSPDAETRAAQTARGGVALDLPQPTLPPSPVIDRFTAIALFFHDHDWEAPILAQALATPAFYIGAQGSQRAAAERRAALAGLGVGPEAIARLHGPIGLIPSARDPGVLAVSVLAQLMDIAQGPALEAP